MHSIMRNHKPQNRRGACCCALLLFILCTGDPGMATEEKEKLIFGFDNPAAVQQWRSIDDVVMGGVSQSVIKAGSQGTVLFTGTVSLENFGGFASTSSMSKFYLSFVI